MSAADIRKAAEEAEEVIDNLGLAHLELNDVGNARRLLTRFGNDVRHTQWIGLFVWDETHWKRDDGEIASFRLAVKTAEAMLLEELQELRKSQEREPIQGASDKEKDAARNRRERALAGFHKFAIESANASRLKNMLAIAKKYVEQPLEAWNTNSNLFNVLDGTLELIDGDVRRRQHRREDYITCMAATRYDPEAQCPLFEKTIRRCLPEDNVRAFVQRYYGASLVDSSGDQAMVVHHGGGANGKSTVIDAIAHVMGAYAVTTDVGLLLHSDAKAASGRPDPSLIKLSVGPRLVRAAEPELGVRLSESLIKRLTGGEPIEARDMWAKPIEFNPSFKISLACNARPPIRGGDYGIWRRLILVPWHVKIPEDERDPAMGAKLKLEAAGILNWLIAGWQDWHMEGGLKPPAEVLAATQEYRQDNDVVGRFLEECCERDPHTRIEAKELHQAFTAWCEREQVNVLTLSLFGKRLTDRAIERQESHGATYRLGLKLTPAALAAVEAVKRAERDREIEREQKRGRRGLSDEYPG